MRKIMCAGQGRKLTPSPVKQLALEHGIEVYQRQEPILFPQRFGRPHEIGTGQ